VEEKGQCGEKADESNELGDEKDGEAPSDVDGHPEGVNDELAFAEDGNGGDGEVDGAANSAAKQREEIPDIITGFLDGSPHQASSAPDNGAAEKEDQQDDAIDETYDDAPSEIQTKQREELPDVIGGLLGRAHDHDSSARENQAGEEDARTETADSEKAPSDPPNAPDPIASETQNDTADAKGSDEETQEPRPFLDSATGEPQPQQLPDVLDGALNSTEQPDQESAEAADLTPETADGTPPLVIPDIIAGIAGARNADAGEDAVDLELAQADEDRE
jgi:hypothetical protein